MMEGRLAVVAADDAEFWLSLRREVPELSSELVGVHSGRDCLRAIEDPRVRLAVLDTSLRDVAGMHLLHLVRRIRPDLGVIVTFEHSDQAQEREARQAGLLYYGDRREIRDLAAVLRKGMARVNGAPAGAGAPPASGSAPVEGKPERF
jgi:DNA-binding NtrC family response regulator